MHCLKLIPPRHGFFDTTTNSTATPGCLVNGEFTKIHFAADLNNINTYSWKETNREYVGAVSYLFYEAMPDMADWGIFITTEQFEKETGKKFPELVT
jgi:hypothetical protein